ncbi:recombinase family protein, partial [Candidatus Woesearchaeota archaeon]|nr:recombinase family protein [Candidatus Woesearchaeota archaeon]
MIAKSKPAVGYIRMSSDQQQDSPARQRRDVQALADRMGYEIIKWYEDHGLTGTESSKRKDFQKLLADAKAGSFCAVLLSEQSRMSREDIFDCMQHWRLFRD